MASTTAGSPICFGNVVKLLTKPDDDTSSMGFLEQKNGKLVEHLLVMGPVKESAKDKFHEAEFIVAPIRCDKPPADGTALKYKQPFVLMTSSQFEAYSLNNKMHAEDTIGLQCRDVKGEMYVAFEKEGYTMEANVMDGDSSLDLVVVDSNRMRKKYNKKLALFNKSKSLALGGFVTCGSKGKPMSLRIVRVPGSETKHFVQTAIVRRRSTLTPQQAQQQLNEAKEKADESSQATHTDDGAKTPTGTAASPVVEASATTKESSSNGVLAAEATPSLPHDAALVTATTTTTAPVEHAAPAPAVAVVAAVGSHEPSPSTASTTESTASTSEATVAAATETAVVAAAPAVTTTTATTNAPLVEVAADPALEEKAATVGHDVVEEKTATVPLAPADPAAAKTPRASLKTEAVPMKAGASATPSSTPGVTPQAAALAIPQSPKKQLGEQQLSSLTVTSEAEGGDEKLDSNCLGENKCAIM